MERNELVPLTPAEACDFLRDECGITHTTATLAKLRCVGGGPVYQKYGRLARYTRLRLREYAAGRISGELRSTSEPVEAGTISPDRSHPLAIGGGDGGR